MYIKQNVEKILFCLENHTIFKNISLMFFFPSFIFSVKRFVLFLKNKIIIILLIFFVNDLKIN